MNEIQFDTIKTAKISGTGRLTGMILKNFADSIPEKCTISLKPASSYPGEYGVSPWSLTATWKED